MYGVRTSRPNLDAPLWRKCLKGNAYMALFLIPIVLLIWLMQKTACLSYVAADYRSADGRHQLTRRCGHAAHHRCLPGLKRSRRVPRFSTRLCSTVWWKPRAASMSSANGWRPSAPTPQRANWWLSAGLLPLWLKRASASARLPRLPRRFWWALT